MQQRIFANGRLTVYAATVVFTNKRSQAEDIYSLFSNKYLGDDRDNVHFQSLQGVQQCLLTTSLFLSFPL